MKPFETIEVATHLGTRSAYVIYGDGGFVVTPSFRYPRHFVLMHRQTGLCTPGEWCDLNAACAAVDALSRMDGVSEVGVVELHAWVQGNKDAYVAALASRCDCYGAVE